MNSLRSSTRQQRKCPWIFNPKCVQLIYTFDLQVRLQKEGNDRGVLLSESYKSVVIERKTETNGQDTSTDSSRDRSASRAGEGYPT